MNPPARLLLVSGAAEMLAGALLGFVMLAPLQPWGRKLAPRLPSTKQLLSVHLDLVMLALMQLAGGAGLAVAPIARGPLVAGLLALGAWTGFLPYVFRIAGINAFVLAGRAPQIGAALLSLAGTSATVAAWALMLEGWAG
jgi:hypothetical protein